VQDLQLSSGDLVPAGRGFATVTGTPYLRQRIAMALQVPYGSDPFNPLWGSTLPLMIGSPQVSGTPSLISSEVSRVLQQIIAAQQLITTNAALTGSQTPLSAGDVIASVNSVQSVQSASDPETVQVTLALTTVSGQTVTISRTLSGS
jgi:phage baseplate assembly protein W